MPPPVNRRDFDAFLSHAHVDRKFVDELYRWLTEVASMNIWYDAKQLPGGDFAAGLTTGIERSRAAIIVASSDAIMRGWVKREVGIAQDEFSRSEDFRMIVLRIGDAKVDELLRGLSWIDVPGGELTAEIAASVLAAFHPLDRLPDPGKSRDVYVSASWQTDDNVSARAVCRKLVSSGFRLIGDSKTQRGFSDDRVADIMRSCGAAVVVLPYRNATDASATTPPYRYFLQELDQPLALELPTVVIADPRIRRADGADGGWLRQPTDSSQLSPEIDCAIAGLWDEWVEPSRRHTIFYATELTAEAARRGSDVRRLIEPCPPLSAPTSRRVTCSRRSCRRSTARSS